MGMRDGQLQIEILDDEIVGDFDLGNDCRARRDDFSSLISEGSTDIGFGSCEFQFGEQAVAVGVKRLEFSNRLLRPVGRKLGHLNLSIAVLIPFVEPSR